MSDVAGAAVRISSLTFSDCWIPVPRPSIYGAVVMDGTGEQVGGTAFGSIATRGEFEHFVMLTWGIFGGGT